MPKEINVNLMEDNLKSLLSITPDVETLLRSNPQYVDYLKQGSAGANNLLDKNDELKEAFDKIKAEQKITSAPDEQDIPVVDGKPRKPSIGSDSDIEQTPPTSPKFK